MIRLGSALAALVLAIAVSACGSTESATFHERATIDGPREVVLVGPRYPWTVEIESRLRERGYAVRRFASTGRVYEQVDVNRAEAYREAAARVALVVHGYAPTSGLGRCIGGGFRFDYINAEVIDIMENETLAYYSESGHSEDCAPVSGTIFTDIVDMVDAVFIG